MVLCLLSGCAVLTVSTGFAAAQTAGSTPAGPQTGAPAAPQSQDPASGNGSTAQAQAASVSPAAAVQKTPDQTTEAKPVRASDRKRAASLYIEASKQFQKEHFEEAMHGYQRAAELDPSNPNYMLSAELARSHLVTALIQQAAKARILGDSSSERAALERALDLDPKNIQVIEHLREMGEDATRGDEDAVLNFGGVGRTNSLSAGVELEPTPGVHTFHLHTDQRQIIQQVFKAYGLEATIDESVRIVSVRFDLDQATFAEATKALALVTNSFYVPLDAHRALVAHDTADNRRQFVREDFETIYLPGLTATELTDVTSIAKNVFDVQQVSADASAGTVLLRAPGKTLNAFNDTVRQIMDGHSQVMLEVNMIQIAHTSDRNTGVQPPQSLTAFNVYAEEQSILNANQSLVQQIISSGLAAPGDTLAILGILLASGQVSGGGALTSGAALFGGGLTQSAFAPGPVTANLNLNSSDSRELDKLQLHLGDGEAGTVRSGTRYPIQTSSFSGLSASLPSIPGLTGVGSSSSLAGLLANLGGSVPNIPQVEYQDLGLTLKATPKVVRNGDVALTIDLKLTALAGSSINGNPILTNQAYSGIVTLRQGEAIVVVSNINKQQMRSISGVPGFSEIPGLNDVTSNDTQKSYASLLIIMTPHVIRGTQAAGHSPMFTIDKNPPAH